MDEKKKTLVSDESLMDVAGGQDGGGVNGMYASACPRCDTMNDPYKSEPGDFYMTNYYRCSNCGMEYIVHDTI